MLTGHPMILKESDGHTAWVNSAALRAAHISASHEGSGGRQDRARHCGQSYWHAAGHGDRHRVGRKTEAQPSMIEASQLDKAFAAMRAIGITSVQDAAVDEHVMQDLPRLYDKPRLNMRVRGSL